MMKSDSILLFNKYDLDLVLGEQSKKVRDSVSKIPTQLLLEANLEDLILSLEKEIRIEPIRLLEDEISVDQTEIKVDVSHDFRRAVFDRSRPFYVDGLRVSYYVPFMGDAQLFKCKPNTFTLNPPRARISGSELALDYDQPDREVPATKRAFEGDLKNVRQWTEWVMKQVDDFNQGLSTKLRQELSTRQQNLKTSQQQIGNLGFKMRPKAVESITSKSEPKRHKGQAKRFPKKSPVKVSQYDIALSFSGEDRPYVERVATILRDAGIRLFYDKFEEVDLWGRNLADHLSQVYANSRFVVMFVSKHYVAKAWPNHERKHAQARAIENQEDLILPARFDDSEIPGLPATTAYVDLRKTSADELAQKILKKLGAKEQSRPSAQNGVDESLDSDLAFALPDSLPDGTPIPANEREASIRVWRSLAALEKTGQDLWLKVSDENLAAFAEKRHEAEEHIRSGALFFSEEDFGALQEIMKAADFYLKGKATLSDIYNGTVHGDTVWELAGPGERDLFVDKEVRHQIRQNRRWLTRYRGLLEKIRSSFHKTVTD